MITPVSTRRPSDGGLGLSAPVEFCAACSGVTTSKCRNAGHRASAVQLGASQVNEFLQSHTVLGQFLLADVGDSEEQAAVAFFGV
jgi:hypothetical protein